MSFGKTKDLAQVKAGDRVVRMLGGKLPMTLTVTEVRDGIIFCGPWTFDQASGAEIDDDLGWGPQYGETGSYIIRKAE